MKLNLLTLFLVFDHYIGFFASPIAEPQDNDFLVVDEESEDYFDVLSEDDCFLPEELGHIGE